MASKFLLGLYACIPSPWRLQQAEGEGQHLQSGLHWVRRWMKHWIGLRNSEGLPGPTVWAYSPVSASIDPVHFCHDLIDSVAGIAHLLGNSNGKTHFPIQEGRSLQVSMQGWERPPRYFIKICTVIFPLLGRDNLDLVCVCFSCLWNIWLRCSCAACSGWGVWDGLIPPLSPSCHCWQLSVKPLLKGLNWGETQSLP